MLYNYKTFNFSFIIIATEGNIGLIKSTIRSIKNNYKNTPYICILPKHIHEDSFKEIEELCECYRGKDTLMSLINTGMTKGGKEWNMLVMEGVWVKAGIDKKYSLYLENENDIFFPIVADYNTKGSTIKIYNTFDTCTLNGLTIHKKMFKKNGKFADAPIEISKLIWGNDAINNGAKFKAILGTKIC